MDKVKFTGSPKTLILLDLLAGKALTVQRAFYKFHTTELRKAISRLRDYGYPISDRPYRTLTADGREVEVKEYYIKKEDLENAKNLWATLQGQQKQYSGVGSI